MIAEKMQRTIDNMRHVLARGNGDFEALAPFFLDNLESEVERVAGLEGAAVLNFDGAPGNEVSVWAQQLHALRNQFVFAFGPDMEEFLRNAN